jgi:hypothetical protein
MGKPLDRNWRLIYANWQTSGKNHLTDVFAGFLANWAKEMT